MVGGTSSFQFRHNIQLSLFYIIITNLSQAVQHQNDFATATSVFTALAVTTTSDLVAPVQNSSPAHSAGFAQTVGHSQATHALLQQLSYFATYGDVSHTQPQQTHTLQPHNHLISPCPHTKLNLFHPTTPSTCTAHPAPQTHPARPFVPTYTQYV